MEKHSGSAETPEKLAEAVLYLCQQSSEDPNFGEAKLAKLLYFADCDAFEHRGEPITGSTYLHLPNGPHPENWDAVRSGMESEGDIAVRTESAPGGRERKRPTANRPLRPSLLSAEETAALDRQLARFASFNAGEIVGYSRRTLGWRATERHEPVPYQGSRFSAPVRDDVLLEEGAARHGRRIQPASHFIRSWRILAGSQPKTCRKLSERDAPAPSWERGAALPPPPRRPGSKGSEEER